MKILLADDSVTAQNMGKKILSEAGHEVVCVSNGAAALKKVSEQEPDLVILDIYMPGYSGLEVCQRLKEGTATANLPVVLTVGKLEPFRKEDAQKVRAEALIVKPFEASELAGAVARFGEMVAANPSKTKNKGKLGPQVKAKPQWDEPPEDEFVNTTQKLEEQGYTPSAAPASAEVASEKVDAAIEPKPSGTASEFEVAPAPEIAEFSAAARTATSSGEDFGAAGVPRITESPEPSSAAAEFGVQEESAEAANDQVGFQAKAAAAAAGADFGRSGGMPEFPSSPSQSFEITAPLESHTPEPAAFTAQIAADAPDFSGALSVPPAAELSASMAEPYAAPPVDPAFDPDRTQWVTEFPTRFGIAEGAAKEAEAPANAEPEPEAASAPDEIAAILSNLPGGIAITEGHKDSGQFGQRPWPLEDADGWKAEEIPVEDGDSSVSLAEEMEKAAGPAGSEQRVEPSFAEPVPPVSSEEAPPAMRAEPHFATSEEPVSREEEPHAVSFEEREEECQPAPVAAVEVTQANTSEENSATAVKPAEAEVPAALSTPEVKLAPTAPDRVAGVMQSAAMAIATRATVSAVASQLHQPPEKSNTGPSAIEELVVQVLDRLKPKLIAEIKRELKTEDK